MADKRPTELFLKWDAAQVLLFIRLVLPQEEWAVAPKFLEHNIEGLLLPYLTCDHLKEVGVTLLNLRLVIKRLISDLIVYHYQTHPPKLMADPEYGLASTFIGMELLLLLTVLIRDMVKKLTQKGVTQAVSLALQNLAVHELSLPTLPLDKLGGLTPLEIDVRKLNDNFNKLKKDLIPVIRLLKDSKPLPTPTLDPGHSVTLDLPQYSYMLQMLDEDPPTLMALMAVPAQSTVRPKMQKAGSFTLVETPAVSNRYSLATLLSMGTGKVVQQLVPKLMETKLAPDFKLQKVQQRRREDGRPLEAKTLVQLMRSATPTTKMPMPANEPLKQLRASLDDSCLKILQQAMKRHHISRDDWLKYVLVICYGNKERILKLAEKPVIIFKELQEMGKHPAIMLRQLAEAPEDGAYDDLRIADEIPGGTL